MLPDKIAIQVVEEAMGIELRDWQIDYILGRSEHVAPGRGTGKTLAYMIKIILSEGEPIHLYETEELNRLSDEPMTYYARGYFFYHLLDLYNSLSIYESRGLKLRKIYFYKKEYEKEKRNDQRHLKNG